jgi:hypothetical protein
MELIRPGVKSGPGKIHNLIKLEAISKMQIRLKSKRHTLINTIRCVIPPTRGRGPIRRRLNSYGGTGEKA